MEHSRGVEGFIAEPGELCVLTCLALCTFHRGPQNPACIGETVKVQVKKFARLSALAHMVS